MASRTHRFVAVTAGLTFVLILIGEFTSVSGSGATCGLRWPDCGGQLIPFGLAIHDFIEWFHRAFAGTVGLFIIGSAIALWRRYDDRWLRTIGILAVILLPLQVFLGGVTVTFSGLFPAGYQPRTQAVHHFVAILIYATMLFGVAWSRRADLGLDPTRHDVARAGRFALLSLPVVLLFSRGTILPYTTPVHIVHHATELVLFTGLVLTLDRARATGNRMATVAALTAFVLSIALIMLGVGLFPYVALIQYTYYALLALIAGLLLYVTRTANRPTTADGALSRSA